MGKEKSEKIFVYGGDRAFTRIHLSGIYDYEQLLRGMQQYFFDRNYYVTGQEHSEAVRASTRDFVIDWFVFRDVTDYIRFVFNVDVWIMRQHDIIVEEHGKQVKKQQADIEVRFKASMVKNYKNTFKKTAMGKFLRETYEKYVVKQQLEHFEDKLKAEADGFLDAVKNMVSSIKKSA